MLIHPSQETLIVCILSKGYTSIPVLLTLMIMRYTYMDIYKLCFDTAEATPQSSIRVEGASGLFSEKHNYGYLLLALTGDPKGK